VTVSGPEAPVIVAFPGLDPNAVPVMSMGETDVFEDDQLLIVAVVPFA
jgi:hypothetical protein